MPELVEEPLERRPVVLERVPQITFFIVSVATIFELSPSV